MKHTITAVLFATVAAALLATEAPKSEPMSKVEVMAMQAIMAKQAEVQTATQEFSTEVCKAHGIANVAECNIDPQAKTVSKAIPPAKKEGA